MCSNFYNTILADENNDISTDYELRLGMYFFKCLLKELISFFFRSTLREVCRISPGVGDYTIYGTSSPQKSEQTLTIFLGKCPTTSPLLITATVY